MITDDNSQRPISLTPVPWGFAPAINRHWLGFAALLSLLVCSPSALAQTTLAPAELSFGNEAVGVASAPRTATLSNTQTVPLMIFGVSIGGGTTPGDFDFSSTCPLAPNTLGPGKRCTITVTFTPLDLGGSTATLTVTQSASTSPQSVSLTGNGIPQVTVSSASLMFSSIFVGTTSASKIVTLTNNLKTELSVFSAAASGEFTVTSNTCGSGVSAGMKCTIGVSFTPTVLGLQQGTLTIDFSARGGPVHVALSGTGNDTGLIAIDIQPENQSIPAGTALQYMATGVLKNGVAKDFTSLVTWSSSAPGVATISPAGVATGLTSGTTTIAATLGSFTPSASLSVTSSSGFVLTGSMNTPRWDPTSTLLNSGMVLIAGGLNNNGYVSSAELYDPIVGAFTLTGSLDAPRYAQSATLLNNGMVLIAGGYNNGVSLADAELYNPTTGVFTATGSLSSARFGHTATLLSDGKVLIAGGYGSGGVLTSAELYDPSTAKFSTAGNLNVARYGHTATILNNGKILIAGGYGTFAPLVSAELYDPLAGTFTPTGSMVTAARASHTATLLNNGMVLVAAGYNGTILYFAEVYNPDTGLFAATGSLNFARDAQTATLLNNGLVLIAGGEGTSNILASAELYDPASGIFSVAGSMENARYAHTAVLLNNGMAMVAGGSDAPSITSTSVLTSAELYQPASLTPPNLVSIAITPGVSTLSTGGTQQFIATGTLSDNSMQQLASVTWSSSNASVAQISNDASNHGTALAVAPGTVTITAAAGAVSGTATLTVTNP